MTQTTVSRTSSAHLTFDEMAARGLDATPCICWHNGRNATGKRGQQIHPAEYDDGGMASYEAEYDI